MASMNIFRDMRKDTDRDGVPDWRDQDDDNDGILDRFDRTPKGTRLGRKKATRARGTRREGSTKIVKPSRGPDSVVLSFAFGRILNAGVMNMHMA